MSGELHDTEIAELVDELAQMPKLRGLDRSVIDRVVRREGPREPKRKELIKRVKRKLHQVGGAYFVGDPRYGRWLSRLKAARPGPDRLAIVRSLLTRHASTNERAPMLEAFYAALAQHVGAADQVLDLACGFNPLARPWMPKGWRRYTACDIYRDMISFIAEASVVTGFPVETFTHDLLGGPPEREADLVLILKTLPCLEQVDETIGPRLLSAIKADRVILTYPTASLGGKQKNMPEFYRARFHMIVRDLDWRVQEIDLPVELGFLLTRR